MHCPTVIRFLSMIKKKNLDTIPLLLICSMFLCDTCTETRLSLLKRKLEHWIGVLLHQTLMQGPRYIEGEKQDAVRKLQGPVQEGARRHSGGAPSNWPEWNEHGHHQVASPLKQPGHCMLQGRISSCMPVDSFCVGSVFVSLFSWKQKPCILYETVCHFPSFFPISAVVLLLL